MTYVWLVMSYNYSNYKPSLVTTPSVHSTPELAFQHVKKLVQQHNDDAEKYGYEGWTLEIQTPPDPDRHTNYEYYVYNDCDVSIWIERIKIDADDSKEAENKAETIKP